MALTRITTEAIGQLVRHVVQPLLLPAVEKNLIPDVLVRYAVTRELFMELEKIRKLSGEERMRQKMAFINELKTLPIAILQHKANDQHYELPQAFFQLVLGPCLKYSSGLWPSPSTTFEESETLMLDLYCERAGLVDGMKIIDLGCGWGSVTLYVAAKYPNSTVVSISNSNSQREFIMSSATSRGLSNVHVYTGDIASFHLPPEHTSSADRVISIEMFEHMKNYDLLMAKVASWLKPSGKLFIHIFTHKDFPSHFKEGWMTDNFFSGGTLPSHDLLLYFQRDLQLEQHWFVNGTHYQKTQEAWLRRMDSQKSVIMPILAETYGAEQALKWFVNWRLFFLTCSEFFGICNGEEYIVSHYLFAKAGGGGESSGGRSDDK